MPLDETSRRSQPRVIRRREAADFIAGSEVRRHRGHTCSRPTASISYHAGGRTNAGGQRQFTPQRGSSTRTSMAPMTIIELVNSCSSEGSAQPLRRQRHPARLRTESETEFREFAYSGSARPCQDLARYTVSAHSLRPSPSLPAAPMQPTEVLLPERQPRSRARELVCVGGSSSKRSVIQLPPAGLRDSAASAVSHAPGQ